MRTLVNRAWRGTLALSMLAATAGAASAQLPNASPAAMALGSGYTARADGYDAVAWNPANLGMPGHTSFSLTLLGLAANSGMDPIALDKFAPYSGENLPANVRDEWLQTVRAKGGENLSADGGITLLGLSLGNIGLQIGTFASASGKLSPDMFQALMFGNAGRTGTAEDLQFSGSTAQAALFTTGGLSYGRTIASAKGRTIGVGATVKYTVANMLLMAQDQGSAVTSNSVSMKYPIAYSNPDSTYQAGSGMGLDVGATLKQGKLTYAATIQNIVNTFAWDETKLVSKPGTAFFDGTTNTTDFDDQAYTAAPQSLRDRVANYKFKPAIAAGVAYNLNGATTLSADARKEVTGGISTGPETRVGGGVEFRGVPFLALRGGAEYVTGGFGVSGGLGLHLGPYELGVSGVLLSANGGKQPGFALNVLSIH